MYKGEMMSWKTILQKYNMEWLLQNVWYRLDWRKPNSQEVKIFLRAEVLHAMRLKAEEVLPTFLSRNNDKIMIECLKYVKNLITYENDSVRFGVAEKWQLIEETLLFKKGDCEDGAILIYCLARAHGISPAQIRLTAGWVENNGKQEGHCYIEYMPDSSFRASSIGEWYTIDWCYWPDTKNFTERFARDEDKYLIRWWSVTDFSGD